MKVFLFCGLHPIYEDIIKFPPTGIEYISNIKKESFDSLEIYTNKIYIFKKTLFTKISNFLGLPRIYYSLYDCDLIHSSRGFLIISRKPWVVDIEHVASFVGMNHWSLSKSKKIISKFLKSKNCKKILPHCIAAKNSFISIFGNKFNDKLEVIYPAIKVYNFKHTKNEKIRLLFVGKDFEAKGGKEVLNAYKILKRKYDIELVVKSKVPNKILINFKKDKDIIFSNEIVSRKELFQKYYFSSDIFVFPTYIDSFGYVLLEAMVAGLPIISTDIFAIPEIVEDGKNGFLIKSPLSWANENYLFKWKSWNQFISLTKQEHPEIVKQLVEKLSLLIEDSSVRKRMGRYGRRLVEKGKFSIRERNKKLKNVYEEVLTY